jgi:hypothetical protein
MFEHKHHLEEFYNMAYKHGLDLSDKKLEIGKTKMEFLGLVIFQGSV